VTIDLDDAVGRYGRRIRQNYIGRQLWRQEVIQIDNLAVAPQHRMGPAIAGIRHADDLPGIVDAFGVAAGTAWQSSKIGNGPCRPSRPERRVNNLVTADINYPDLRRADDLRRPVYSVGITIRAAAQRSETTGTC
jgi:hypothetical protein